MALESGVAAFCNLELRLLAPPIIVSAFRRVALAFPTPRKALVLFWSGGNCSFQVTDRVLVFRDCPAYGQTVSLKTGLRSSHGSSRYCTAGESCSFMMCGNITLEYQNDLFLLLWLYEHPLTCSTQCQRTKLRAPHVSTCYSIMCPRLVSEGISH